MCIRDRATVAPFLLAILNPTSVNAHLGDLRSLPVDAAMLSEVSLTFGGQKFAKSQLAEGDRGFTAVWGPPQPPRAMQGVAKSEWDAVPGGVGAMARRPLKIQEVETPLAQRDLVREGEPDLLEEGRLLHTAIPMGSGTVVVHLLTYYGFSGARAGNTTAKRLNEAGLRQALRYAAALGQVPIILGGDLNDNPDTSPTLWAALRAGWQDAAQLEANKADPPTELPHTFDNGTATSRIDLALLNEEATLAFDKCWTAEAEEYQFPQHRPVFVRFCWQNLCQQVQRIKKPQAIPRPHPPEGAAASPRDTYF